MDTLLRGESIQLLVQKHWFVMARHCLVAILALFLPALLFVFAPAINLLPPQIATSLMGTGPLGTLITVVYLMAILAYLFFAWMDYFLDFWMVTPTRIIAVNQRGFFDRVVDEIPLDRVQDAEMEVAGILETVLNFGTLRIQTAGEEPFKITDIPNPTRVKAAIFANRGARDTVAPHY